MNPWETVRKSQQANDLRISIARQRVRMAGEERTKIEMKEAEKDDPKFRVIIITTYYLALK